MQYIETAWKQFFLQFVPHVFTEGELVEDPDNKLYPRITFSYQIGDFLTNTLTTFQVWTWSHNNSDLWAVCDKIAEEVPVECGTDINIAGGIIYEYKHPVNNNWIQFNIEDFQAIADAFPDKEIQWRKIESNSSGGINIYRGSPFLTPSPKDEAMSRVMYGTLTARYLNIV